MHVFCKGRTGGCPSDGDATAGSCAAAATAKAAEVVFMAKATVALMRNMDSLPLSPSSSGGMLN